MFKTSQLFVDLLHVQLFVIKMTNKPCWYGSAGWRSPLAQKVGEGGLIPGQMHTGSSHSVSLTLISLSFPLSGINEKCVLEITSVLPGWCFSWLEHWPAHWRVLVQWQVPEL